MTIMYNGHKMQMKEDCIKYHQYNFESFRWQQNRSSFVILLTKLLFYELL